jgi:hypothetical protein
MENSSRALYEVGDALASSRQQAIPGSPDLPGLTSLYAKYDGKKIHFATPYPLQPGDRLIITVLPQTEEFAEREDWLALAASGLLDAYGDDEPEYTLAHLKERNPDYAGG